MKKVRKDSHNIDDITMVRHEEGDTKFEIEYLEKGENLTYYFEAQTKQLTAEIVAKVNFLVGLRA